MIKCLQEWRKPGSTLGKQAKPTRPLILPVLPKTRAGVSAYFGDAAKLGQRAFGRKHMAVIKNLPGQWNRGRGRLYMNKLAEVHLREALAIADEFGVLEEIETLGCFSWRHQRHDSSRPLSYHAYGIAFDINPRYNQAKQLPQNTKPFQGRWAGLYPKGVSYELVTSFKLAGFSWGGDWTGYVDPMHFELLDR